MEYRYGDSNPGFRTENEPERLRLPAAVCLISLSRPNPLRLLAGVAPAPRHLPTSLKGLRRERPLQVSVGDHLALSGQAIQGDLPQLQRGTAEKSGPRIRRGRAALEDQVRRLLPRMDRELLRIDQPRVLGDHSARVPKADRRPRDARLEEQAAQRYRAWRCSASFHVAAQAGQVHLGDQEAPRFPLGALPGRDRRRPDPPQPGKGRADPRCPDRGGGGRRAGEGAHATRASRRCSRR